MEHRRYFDTIETWSQHNSKKVPRTEHCGRMPYRVRNIRGLTADILRKLYERLYS